MTPQNDQQSGQVGAPQNDQSRTGRGIAAPPPRNYADSQRAAADLIRGQLDSIYSSDATHTTQLTSPHTSAATETQTQTANPQPVQATATQQANTQDSVNHGLRTAPPQATEPSQQPQAATSPYQRTMVEETVAQQQQAIQQQWQQYHSAWQQYYQQYYQRYYMSNAYAQKEADSTTPVDQEAPNDSSDTETKDRSVTQSEAMKELRESIRKKVTESTEKVKKSRHFIPAIAGISVLVLFMFLQYNRVVFGTVAAYVSPGNIEPQNIIVDPTTNVEVGPEPRMIIPKINVDAPVVYGVGPDHDSQMKAMESGIAHFAIPGANAVPGQVGNTVMAAHSSNDVFAPGDYKFVFAQNERLTKGDVIHMHYEGTRYTYSVTTTEVVLPTEVSKIQLDTDKPMLTLISCVPLGTAQKRLLVFAEQVSPNSSQAAAANDDASTPEASGNIPGQPSPTLLERIFGAN